MHIFYDADFEGSSGELEDEEFRHCVRVLRHQAGDTIEIINGRGLRSEVEITRIEKNHLSYESRKTIKTRSKPFSVHLMIAPTKNLDRMEWMIEKCGEMQLDKLSFIYSERSIRKKLNLSRLEKKTISALKQSGGSWKMELSLLDSWPKVLDELPGSPAYICYLTERADYIMECVEPNQNVTFLIGPEGDFSPEEVQTACTHGAIPLNLGQSTLRTETAGLFVTQAMNLINQY